MAFTRFFPYGATLIEGELDNCSTHVLELRERFPQGFPRKKG